MVAAAVGTAAVVGGVMAADSQRSAGNQAADAQTQASEAGIAEQRRQFEKIQQLLSPYVTVGNQALAGQQALLGIDGVASQKAAIDALQNSPQYASLLKAGENSILSNAAATGGLRGGNTQAALAQFSPALLSQVIQQQYGNLSSLSAQGQNAAAMTGSAGQTSASNISNLLQQQGAAQAGAALSSGKAQSNMFGSLTQGLGLFAGLGGSF